MKKLLLNSILIALLAQGVRSAEHEASNLPEVVSSSVAARSLADASDMVRLMNDLKWEELKKRLRDANQIVIVENFAKLEDWHGVGAYRGSEFNEDRTEVKHRFSYGPGRKSVHEVWLTYSLADDGYGKPGFAVLGW